MKSLSMLVCLMSGFSGVALADNAPAVPSSYKQKMHDCATQMKTDHPDMNHDARRKACRQQLGPAPTAAGTAAAVAPATPSTPKP